MRWNITSDSEHYAGKKMHHKDLKTAFMKSFPVMCSYLFVSTAYGLMMAEAGFPWYISLFISLTIYTGAFQFVLISFLGSNTPAITILLTAFLMNARQSFYSLTFVREFQAYAKEKMGVGKLIYMIHTMTDETYAVNCTLQMEPEQKRPVMLWVAFLSRCWWMCGTILGGLAGQLLPLQLDGIDFCMTALFITIFLDQWQKAESHIPALIGLGTAISCLFFFGKNNFILPALVLTSFLLCVIEKVKWKNKREKTNGTRQDDGNYSCGSSPHVSASGAAFFGIWEKTAYAGRTGVFGESASFCHYGNSDCILHAQYQYPQCRQQGHDFGGAGDSSHLYRETEYFSEYYRRDSLLYVTLP